MSFTVLVLSRVPSLSKELSATLPHVNFQSIIEGPETSDQREFLNFRPIELIKEKLSVIKAAEIIVADVDFIAPYIHELTNVKWIQGTYAGVDFLMSKIDHSKISSLPLVTRYSGTLFGSLMSEYVVAQIVNHERDVFRMYENQKLRYWKGDAKIFIHRCFRDLTIGVMGVGQIGSRIIQTLHFFGAKVLGFGKQSHRDGLVMKYLHEYYTFSSISDFLNKVDYIINILPSTSETTGLLNGNILEQCKENSPVFINIGRGSIIKEEDLIAALNQKWISFAILDVFNKEPLPESSPLWTMPTVQITPHVSGVIQAKHIASHFKDNFSLYIQNKPLMATVDFRKGY